MLAAVAVAAFLAAVAVAALLAAEASGALSGGDQVSRPQAAADGTAASPADRDPPSGGGLGGLPAQVTSSAG